MASPRQSPHRRLAALASQLQQQPHADYPTPSIALASGEGQTYRVAIIGAKVSGRGGAAARAYHAHPRCQIVGLCDVFPERTAELAETLGVPESAQFVDLDEMISTVKPDLVAIPTGTSSHYSVAKRVLEHGVHIEVEKPMCSNLEQADEVLALAKAKGVRSAVHHQGLCGAPMRAILAALKAGKIGKIRHMISSDKGYYGGYGVPNIGTHIVNNLIGLAGNVRRVTASSLTGGRPSTPQDAVAAPDMSASSGSIVVGEHLTATLEFDGGATCTMLQHRFPQVDNDAYSIEILGTEGRLFWKADRLEAAWYLPNAHFIPDGNNDAWEPLENEYIGGYTPSGDTHHEEQDYSYAHEWVCALDEDRDHVCSGTKGRHVMEVLLGIFEAAAYGRPVLLPQQDRSDPLIRWRAENGLAPPLVDEEPGYGPWLEGEDRRLGQAEKYAANWNKNI